MTLTSLKAKMALLVFVVLAFNACSFKEPTPRVVKEGCSSEKPSPIDMSISCSALYPTDDDKFGECAEKRINELQVGIKERDIIIDSCL